MESIQHLFTIISEDLWEIDDFLDVLTIDIEKKLYMVTNDYYFALYLYILSIFTIFISLLKY